MKVIHACQVPIRMFNDMNKGDILNIYSTDSEANALKRMFMSLEKHLISIFQIKQFKTLIQHLPKFWHFDVKNEYITSSVHVFGQLKRKQCENK